jgi:hypothetical protein
LTSLRKNRKKTDPRTPDKQQKCSKRSWEGQMKKWRRLLHEHDTANDQKSTYIKSSREDKKEENEEEEEIEINLDDIEEESKILEETPSNFDEEPIDI